MGFNLADYQPVEDRNRQFWAKHPEGRVLTELVFHDGTRYVVRAEVYTDRDDPRPAATGYAEELVSTRGVNQTSALENCETSAEGRALARLGFAPKGARPSREEMDKANRRTTDANGTKPTKTPAQVAADFVAALVAVDTTERAEKGLAAVIKSPVAGVDVSGLVDAERREVLGVNAGEPVTLNELAVLVLGYVERHQRAVNAAEVAV